MARPVHLRPVDVAERLVELASDADFNGDGNRSDVLLAGAALAAAAALARTAPDRESARWRLAPYQQQLRAGLRSLGSRLSAAAAGALRLALAEMDATAPGDSTVGNDPGPLHPPEGTTAAAAPGTTSFAQHLGPRSAPGYRSRGEKTLLRVSYGVIARAAGLTAAAAKKAVHRGQLDTSDLCATARWVEEARARRLGPDGAQLAAAAAPVALEDVASVREELERVQSALAAVAHDVRAIWSQLGPRRAVGAILGIVELVRAEPAPVVAEHVRPAPPSVDEAATAAEPIDETPPAPPRTKREKLQARQRELLLRRLADGRLDPAVEGELLQSLEAYVATVAHRLGRGYGVQHLAEDLLAEGRMGALEGLRRFDPSRGFLLTTYVTWWVRHHIIRFIENHSRTIRVPMHMNRARAADLGTFDGANLIARRHWDLRSYDTPLGDGSERTLADVVADPAIGCEDDAIERMDFATLIDVVLRFGATRPERDQVILRERLLEAKTLDEVGEKLGLSRERVRQLEVRLLADLRAEVGAS